MARTFLQHVHAWRIAGIAVSALLLSATDACAGAAALGYDDARHLLARTGFGPSEAEVQQLALFSAPNVRGWPGDTAWINSATLLARRQFSERVMGSGGDAAARPAPVPAAGDRMMRALVRADQAVAGWRADPDRLPDEPERLLLPLRPREPATAAAPRERLAAVVRDPAYQLK